MSESETRRLEELWSGEFGDAYSERNAVAGDERGDFWRRLLGIAQVESALEVGCNVGANLRWLGELLEPENVHGVDVNESALAEARRRFPRMDLREAAARELPFADGSIDLVFTMGVLIHLPDESLDGAMAEIVRCSRRYVLCGEYFADPQEEVPYRGQSGALFKRNYGALYLERFPQLTLVDTGFLSHDDGWDDVTWWLLQRA